MDNREQFDNLLSLLYDFPIYCDNEFLTLDTIHIKTEGSILRNNTTLYLADRKIIHLCYHATYFMNR